MAVIPMPEPTKGVIRAPKQPQGAVPTGELTVDGVPIWEMPVTDLVRHPDGRPVKDAVLDPTDGKPKWRKHATTGEALYPIELARMETVTRRFTLHIERNQRGTATGRISKNYHFEPDPTERDRLAKAAKVNEWKESFADAAVARGLSVDELLDQLTGAGKPPEPAKPVAYPRMKAPGKWALNAEHEALWQNGEAQLFAGKKSEAVKAAKDL